MKEVVFLPKFHWQHDTLHYSLNQPLVSGETKCEQSSVSAGVGSKDEGFQGFLHWVSKPSQPYVQEKSVHQSKATWSNCNGPSCQLTSTVQGASIALATTLCINLPCLFCRRPRFATSSAHKEEISFGATILRPRDGETRRNNWSNKVLKEMLSHARAQKNKFSIQRWQLKLE